MLGEIIFQMAYAALAIKSLTQYPYSKAPLRSKIPQISVYRRTPIALKLNMMTAGLMFTTLCLYICAEPWSSQMDGTAGSSLPKPYLNVFDGAMAALAILTMYIVHPGRFLSSKGGSGSNETLTKGLENTA